MPIVVLDAAAVAAALPMAECIPLMRQALLALSTGQVHQPLRTVVRPPAAAGLMALMPSYLAADAAPGADPALAEAAFGVKAVCVFPANPRHGRDAHQGVVVLVDPATGEPQAVLDASAVTRIRTAAASAVATDVLARPDAHVLALVGAGTQARAHLEAILAVRPVSQVRIAARTLGSARALAAEAAARFDVEVTACADVAEAVRGADVVVTATTAREPVVTRADVAPGTHVNAVGSSIPTTRELDGALMAAALVYTDARASLLAESGDFLLARAEGAIGTDHLRGEIGEVLAGRVPGRRGSDDITVFTSLGVSIEDVVAGRHALRTALARGIARPVPF